MGFDTIEINLVLIKNNWISMCKVHQIMQMMHTSMIRPINTNIGNYPLDTTIGVLLSAPQPRAAQTGRQVGREQPSGLK